MLLRRPAAELDEAMVRFAGGDGTLAAFDRLGAGFAVSPRDLDMRGAGDFLGEEQAVYAKLMGVDFYQHLLEQALEQAEGRLPRDWIANEDVRLSTYAQLARITTMAELDSFEAELSDRFGALPAEAETLLALARLRALARDAGVDRVDARPAGIAITPRAFAVSDGKLRHLTAEAIVSCLKATSAHSTTAWRALTQCSLSTRTLPAPNRRRGASWSYHYQPSCCIAAAMARTQNFLRGRRGSQLRSDEREALETTLGLSRTFDARQILVQADTLVSNSILLLDGFMCRYMDDREGHRQLVALHMPGDFVDLHGYPLQRLDHDVGTLTQVTIAFAPHEKLTAVTEAMPHLTRMLWFSTLLDAAMHREWIFRLGRLNALGRVAHFLAETNCRLMAIGASDGHAFRLPLTQSDVAEACGLTNIHVSRMLAELRKRGVADFTGQIVRIEDNAALHKLGEFDARYLYLEDEVLVP